MEVKQKIIIGAITITVVVALFSIMGYFTLKKDVKMNSSSEYTELKKSNEKLKKENEELTIQLANSLNIDTNEDQQAIKNLASEQEVLKIHTQFVKATFSYVKTSDRNKQMIPFISGNQVQSLGLDQELDGIETEINAEIFKETDYLRQIDTNEIEILSRVSVDYNHTQNNRQYVLFKVNYRKDGNEQWKVYNITFQDDRYNQEIK